MTKGIWTILLLGALAHPALKTSFPARNAVVDRPPGKVTLTFSEDVTAIMTTISILKPDSTLVLRLAPRAAKDLKIVDAAIPQPLMPGKYIVKWTTQADDGYVAHGAFAFTILPHR